MRDFIYFFKNKTKISNRFYNVSCVLVLICVTYCFFLLFHIWWIKWRKTGGKLFPFRYIFRSLLECLESANTSHRRRSKCELKGTAFPPRHVVVSLHPTPLLEHPDSLASQRLKPRREAENWTEMATMSNLCFSFAKTKLCPKPACSRHQVGIFMVTRSNKLCVFRLKLMTHLNEDKNIFMQTVFVVAF